MIKRSLLIAALSAAVCLGGQALAQSENGSKRVPMEPEARAEELQRLGKCPLAIPIFRGLVNLGPGYELSQLNLGLCLLTVAKTEPDAPAAAALRQEAAQWIIRAANGDLPNAQKAVVTIYLDGSGIPADPVEAGKWSLIFHANTARRIFGLPDLAPDVQARLDAALTEKTWAEAQARVAAWSPAAKDRSRN